MTDLRALLLGTGDGEHPPGCRHVGTPVEEFPETYSTVLMGGMHAVADGVRGVEARSDNLAAGLDIDMPGMDLCVHSTVLFCEGCRRHSVVSWENYRMVLERTVGVNHVRVHPGEYYLRIVCTSSLLRTPLLCSGERVAMQAINVMDQPYTERDAEVVVNGALEGGVSPGVCGFSGDEAPAAGGGEVVSEAPAERGGSCRWSPLMEGAIGVQWGAMVGDSSDSEG